MIRRWLVAGSLLVVLIAAAWVTSLAWECQAPQPPNQTTPTGAIDQDNCKSLQTLPLSVAQSIGDFGSWLRDAVERNDKVIVAVSTVFIALFTVILGTATGFLWKATRELVHGAEKTAERQLRAYVLVELEEVAFIHNQRHRNSAAVSIQIKNFGKTPAYDLTHTAIADFVALPPMVYPFDFGRKWSSPIVLGPGATMKIIASLDREMSSDEMKMWADKSKTIFAFGQISYRDTFRQKQFTDFRLFDTGMAAPGGSTMRPWESGNNTT